jgi:BASS family bile acid:Na+ symporter
MPDIAQLIKYALSASVFLLVIALGMQATLSQATCMFRHPFHAPNSLLRAVLAMFFIVPILAATVALAFGVPEAVRIALVAMSISPVPPILPSKQIKFGGRETYVYGLLVSVSLVSIVLIPVSVAMIGIIFQRDVHMSFGQISKFIGGTILLPLGLGVILRKLAPGMTMLAGPWIVRVGNLLLLAALLPILAASAENMWLLIGDGTILAIVITISAAMAAGQWIGGPDEHDRTALGIVSAMRHPGVALAIGTTNFPNNKLIPAAIVLYVLIAVIMTTVYGKLRLRNLSRTAHPRATAQAGT